MDFLVLFAVRRSLEGFSTEGAGVRSLPRVNAFVNFHFSQGSNCLVTKPTFVLFPLTTFLVFHHVVLGLLNSLESLGAKLAPVWLLNPGLIGHGVTLLMLAQLPSHLELLTTLVARVLLLVLLNKSVVMDINLVVPEVRQVWRLTHFCLFPFCNKSMTPHRGSTILFRSSQQLPRLRLGPSKGFLS